MQVSPFQFLAVFIWLTVSLAVPDCPAQSKDRFRELRMQMVEDAVIKAGVTDARVIRALRTVPRHEFVPRKIRDRAYLDAGLPIGEQQTISSPFIVAFMTESLDPQKTDRVLEIGTGSGYQAAVLSMLVDEVYSIEIIEPLGQRAAATLKRLKYDNVFTKVGDGFLGWPEYAPFDKIILTCSPEKIPQPLVDQLAEGGRIVVPIGQRHQQTLSLLKKVDGKMVAEALRPTLFVPMTGRAEEQRQVLPDPSKPALLNGDFEQGLDKEGFVKGWYYQRQLELVEQVDAPSGLHYVKFSNSVPGQYAHVMQGFAIDGRKVPRLKLQASFSCDQVARGPAESDLPAIAITFYDDQRKELNWFSIGPFDGSLPWTTKSREMRVPIGAREAIVRIGLFGATGSASFDNISVSAVK